MAPSREPTQATMPLNETNKSLQVGIVGAGIAGLTTAIALLDGGHDVEVFHPTHLALLYLILTLPFNTETKKGSI